MMRLQRMWRLSETAKVAKKWLKLLLICGLINFFAFQSTFPHNWLLKGGGHTCSWTLTKPKGGFHHTVFLLLNIWAGSLYSTEFLKLNVNSHNLQKCYSVGRAVASDSRGPRFESSHRQKIILNIYCQLYWKDENKEKSARIEGQQVKFLPYHDRDRNCVGDEADDGQNQAAKSVDPQA